MNKKSNEIALRSGFYFGRARPWASQLDSPHAQVYKQIATRVWETLTGAEKRTPKVVVQ